MMLLWETELDILSTAEALLQEHPESSLIVYCIVTTENVKQLKELLITVQHLTHRFYKKDLREKPVTTLVTVDPRITRKDLDEAIGYMRKMQQGEHNNVLGFSAVEIESLEKLHEKG
jgi:hypothetical protein